MNTRGNTRGQGINYYQYNFHIADVALIEGDSLRISIRHDMKREILPGISDIGIIMTKK
jgi:gliding motility-associated lipoprotein GldH